MRNRRQLPDARKIKSPMKVSPYQHGPSVPLPDHPFKFPSSPPGVVPKAAANAVAMDGAPQAGGADLASIYGWGSGALRHEGISFLGYAYLSELAQRPEYRIAVETISEEMTRKFVTIEASETDEDKSDIVKAVSDEMERLQIREIIGKMPWFNGFFGRSHIYIDTGDGDDPETLKKPLIFNFSNMKRLKGFVAIDPFWVYPSNYNSVDPLKPDYFSPDTWFVLGKEVHHTRLLTFVFWPVPDVLKPSYTFGGLSLTQQMKPYVDNWLETRESVTKLINSFTIYNLSTNMSGVLEGGAADGVLGRAQMFSNYMKNLGVMITDKEEEILSNLSVPLSGLQELQQQSLELVAFAAQLPLVKYLQKTPSGLNASSDGEMRVFYDRIKSEQERNLGPNLRVIIKCIMLKLFGEIDDAIKFSWAPLWEVDENQRANIRKVEADTAIAYIDSGVLSPSDERKRIAGDSHSAYHGLDADDLPEEESFADESQYKE